jgi:hypothetical protein
MFPDNLNITRSVVTLQRIFLWAILFLISFSTIVSQSCDWKYNTEALFEAQKVLNTKSQRTLDIASLNPFKDLLSDDKYILDGKKYPS